MLSTRKKGRSMGSLSHCRKASEAEAKHEAGKAFGADQWAQERKLIWKLILP